MKAALLCAALVAAACTGGAAGGGAARVSVEPASFDFGNVVGNETVRRDFVLRNVGGAELVITDVKKTCECTVVGGYAKTLAPGASTSLRIELTTPARPGRVAQAFAVLSNDPEQPRVEVKIQATVVAAAKRD